VISDPTSTVERRMHREGATWIVGCDEVGRGALAGPVAVGMVVVDRSVGKPPAGLRDSKMLSEMRREELAPRCHSWARFAAVGLATADEIDEFGIIASLGFAGSRALQQLGALGASVADCTVLLDGSHDWLTPALAVRVPVVTRVKADRDCVSVAAASVVAKVHRDRMMIDYDVTNPGYGWASNKGYASQAHLDAIGRLGPSALHRKTWLHESTLVTLDMPSA
jgi:ribonuclease HII